MARKNQDPGKKRPSASKTSVAADAASKPPVIYLELPEHLVGLKPVLEDLARLHNRKLTGECLQALVEYAEKHNAWPPGGQEGG